MFIFLLEAFAPRISHVKKHVCMLFKMGVVSALLGILGTLLIVNGEMIPSPQGGVNINNPSFQPEATKMDQLTTIPEVAIDAKSVNQVLVNRNERAAGTKQVTCFVCDADRRYLDSDPVKRACINTNRSTSYRRELLKVCPVGCMWRAYNIHVIRQCWEDSHCKSNGSDALNWTCCRHDFCNSSDVRYHTLPGWVMLLIVVMILILFSAIWMVCYAILKCLNCEAETQPRSSCGQDDHPHVCRGLNEERNFSSMIHIPAPPSYQQFPPGYSEVAMHDGKDRPISREAPETNGQDTVAPAQILASDVPALNEAPRQPSASRDNSVILPA